MRYAGHGHPQRGTAGFAADTRMRGLSGWIWNLVCEPSAILSRPTMVAQEPTKELQAVAHSLGINSEGPPCLEPPKIGVRKAAQAQ